MKYTYGLELEAIDFKRSEIQLPDGCTFSKKEVTLVNSDGRATNPSNKQPYDLGGEIQTNPTDNINKQVIIAKKCFKLLKEVGAIVNYRCNTQCHVGGWFHEDDEDYTLMQLKKIQKYAFDNYEQLLRLTMGEGQFNKKPEYPQGFWHHYKERMVPDWKHKFLMEAKTLKEFRAAMFYSKKGTNAPMTFMRQGINTHSFFKTGTVEFRIFWATLDENYVEKMLLFSKLFVDDALGKQNQFKEIVEVFKGQFQPELPFNLKLEQGFQATKIDK